VALPSSVSNRYSLSIQTERSSCRRAKPSLRRVSSLSASSSSSRAASHSSRVAFLARRHRCCLFAVGLLLMCSRNLEAGAKRTYLL
jgi:hypothetical protein